MKNLKRLLVVKLLFLCVLLVFAGQAQALSLSIGDVYYVGHINNGTPADPPDEVNYINYLITLASGAGPVSDGGTGQIYDRLNSTLNVFFPDAVLAGAYKQDNSNTTFGAGYAYVLGKYGNVGDYVWYMAGGFTEDVVLPAYASAPLAQYGLSHTIGFNPGTMVSEPATMLLLGSGLLGLTLVSRRMFRNK